MKVVTSSAARFIADPGVHIGGVLLYGPDHGLVHAYARQLLKERGETVELRGETVQHDPAALYDAAYGSSLFAGMAADGKGGSAIWLRETGERTLPAIEATLADSDAGRNFIVVEAGELTGKSKLRAFFETNPHLAAVGCYAETGEQLGRTLSSAALLQKARFNPEALDYVIARMPPDREAQLQELEKLLTYVGADGAGEKTITLKDVLATIGDAAEEDVYDLPWLVFGGPEKDNVADADRALARLKEEGTSEIQILRALLAHALKLHQVQSLVDAGQTQGQAISSLRPPLFDRDKQRIGAQLRRWRLPALTRAVSAINEAERLSKSTGYPAGVLLGQLCLQLAQV